MNKHTHVVGMLLALVMLGSLSSVWAKLVLAQMPLFTFLWLMVASGMVILLAYACLFKRIQWPWAEIKGHGFKLMLIGLAYFFFYRLAFVYGLSKLPVTTHAYVINFTGLVTMLLSAVMLKEHPSGKQWLCALLALSGVFVYFNQWPDWSEQLALLVLALGVLCLALTNIWIRELSSKGLGSTVLATVAMVLGGTPLVLIGLYADGVAIDLTGFQWFVIVLNAAVVLSLGVVIWSHA